MAARWPVEAEQGSGAREEGQQGERQGTEVVRARAAETLAGEGGAAALWGWRSSSAGGRWPMRAGMEIEAGGSDLDWIWEGEGGGGDWEKGAQARVARFVSCCLFGGVSLLLSRLRDTEGPRRRGQESLAPRGRTCDLLPRARANSGAAPPAHVPPAAPAPALAPRPSPPTMTWTPSGMPASTSPSVASPTPLAGFGGLILFSKLVILTNNCPPLRKSEIEYAMLAKVTQELHQRVKMHPNQDPARSDYSYSVNDSIIVGLDMMADFQLMLLVYAGGVFLTALVTVPNWPFFNRHPLKWMDAAEADRHPRPQISTAPATTGGLPSLNF